MLEITLMRHGRPLLQQTGRLAPNQMGRWIEHYERGTYRLTQSPQ